MLIHAGWIAHNYQRVVSFNKSPPSIFKKERMLDLSGNKIAVIGLGYVGLPLALEFSKKYEVVGFDINSKRVAELNGGKDSTFEISPAELSSAKNIKFTGQIDELKSCNVLIVTVPTPIDKYKQPVLKPLITASEMIGQIIQKDSIVIYESTVYPGATEEDCVPVIEKVSGLTYNKDFFAGYSPERINPGDKEHRVANILKVTSGSNPDIAEFVDKLYSSIITAGTYKATSIKVAEAAKVIENTQRDVNIALINEFVIIFDLLGIDALDVLEAAGTKWNFLPFRPGLVGGHCIGVDPYYLTHKAQSIGYHPEMILAGRRLNDGMAAYVASKLVKRILKERIQVLGAKVLVMGLTFKENCPDIRNTKVVDLVAELRGYDIEVDVLDPWCSVEEAKLEYDLDVLQQAEKCTYDAIVLAVGHDVFKEMGVKGVRTLGKSTHILYDLKYVFSKESVDLRL
jgi:UDP-N-acetyl-D-galactosamine dehydrogenase